MAEILLGILIGQFEAMAVEVSAILGVVVEESVVQQLSYFEQIMQYIIELSTKLQTVLNFLQAVKMFVFLMMFFTCFTNSLRFIKESFYYSLEFLKWFGIYFLPWFGRFTTCALEKLFALPKCFLWYGLDVVSRTLYLPVRLLWYVLDLITSIAIPNNKFFENLDHSIWCLLDDIDHYVHDKDGLDTGVHIIHFPDSVMKKCYTCKIDSLHDPPSASALFSAFLKMIECIGSEI